LFMYTVANEFERYPDGRYSYSPGDVRWAKEVAARIRRVDKVHPVGVHPSHWITEDNPFLTYDGFTQRRPQVVCRCGKPAGRSERHAEQRGVQRRTWGRYDDVHSGLTYYPTHWQGVDYPSSGPDGLGPRRRGDGGLHRRGLGARQARAEQRVRLSVRAGRRPRVRPHDPPVPSAGEREEEGMEDRNGRRYFAAGFTSTASPVFRRGYRQLPAGQLEILHEFFTTRTQYWKMAPHLELVASHNSLLALPGASMWPISRGRYELDQAGSRHVFGSVAAGRDRPIPLTARYHGTE